MRHGTEAAGSVRGSRHAAKGVRKGWIRPALTIFFGAVFLFSLGMIIHTQLQYRASQKFYAETADQFTAPAPQAAGASGSSSGSQTSSGGSAGQGTGQQTSPEDVLAANAAPIVVNFEALQAINSDVIGWIYCEGTPINYPILQGYDNNDYLHRGYDGSYNGSGSIFVEASNRRDFEDANTILYGHHMKDGSMFASLENWQDPAFAAAHPVMWILTPAQDYKVVLVSAYYTEATSGVYSVFPDPGEPLNIYMENVLSYSDFTPAEVPETDKYVLLSTCAYVFTNARYVVHGAMIPADSAGGVPIAPSGADAGAQN